MRSLIVKLISFLGYKLTKIPKGTTTTFREELERFEIFGSEREWRQVMLYGEVFSKIVDVPGDIAEFGVASGVSFKAFVRMNEIVNKSLIHYVAKKKVYGFDTFDGLPDLSKYDNPSNKEYNKKGDFKSQSTLKDLIEFNKVYSSGNLVKGLFEDTLEKFIDNNPHITFSFIHIDCDIYSATNLVLRNLTDRLSVGGIILFDEIFHEYFPGETKGFLDFYNNINKNDKQIKLEFVRSKSMPWKWYCIRTQ